MTSADELSASLSLRCDEMLAASPSTSSTGHPNRDFRRRSERHAFQQVNQKRMSYPIQNRKRPSEDTRLNSAITAGVATIPDRAIQLDERVIRNLRKAEINRQPNSSYFLSVQDELDYNHREQVVEWLSDVCRELQCEADVFPLAVIIMDRYLSHRKVLPREIQAVAGVCLFIASKLKAPTPINIDTLVYWSSRAIQPEIVLPLETMILQTLEWNVTCPTQFDFFDQVQARLPQLAIIRDGFVEIVHGIQKNHKLATNLPSFQCGLALLCAAKKHNESFFQEIAGLTFMPTLSVPGILGVDRNLLIGMLPLVDRTMTSDDWKPSLTGTHAPPSSNRTPSPQLQAVKAPLLSTPVNDSGFCSGASSPESACKKEDMECTPPKMPRTF